MTGLPKANDACWCGSGRKFKRCHKASTERVRPGLVSPRRPVPDSIDKPHYAAEGGTSRRGGEWVQSPDVIERMRRTGAAAAEVLHLLGRAVAPGVTTDELDELCHELAIERGAYPSPLNYGDSTPFPKSVCSSVNEVICHGIPDDRPLRDGDIVNLDVTLFREGVHGDTNRTFLVGTVDPDSRRLVEVTHEAMMSGIEAIGPGEPFNVVGRAIQEHAEAAGFGVVRAFVGHGVNTEFHTDLQVPHYYVPQLTTPMEVGMTFTVEPMITMGTWEFNIWDDDWTAVTLDRKRTAQFEHTVVVTDEGAEILTPWPD